MTELIKHSIAQDADIGRRRVEEKLLLGALKLGAACEHGFFRCFGFGLGAEAAEQWLLHLYATTAGGAVLAWIFKRRKLGRVLIGAFDSGCLIDDENREA